MNSNTKSIFIINCDWRDMFGNSYEEFKDKLERDRLGGGINNFFVFSWAKVNYFKIKNNHTSIHRKTFLNIFRPLLDIWTIPVILYYVWRNKIRMDIWLCYDFGFAPALWLVSRIYGGKLIMCLNNQPRIYSRTRKYGILKQWYSWFIEKYFSHLFDKYFTINETMKKYIENLGIDKNKIYVFSMNTIIRDRSYIDNAKKNIIREKYNIPESNKIIITVARLEAEKNYPKLLELFAGLDDNYTLIALGRGSLLSELNEQCKKLNIQNRVVFTGFVHRNEIWNYYIDSDIFILLSKAEALGVVLWEAMYMNIPVIVSDIPGIIETVGTDGERGRVWNDNLNQNDFNEIVDKINNKNMIKRAKDFVDSKISNNLIINDIV